MGRGKAMGARVALRGQAVHLRAGRIGQADELAHFVETFAGGVVHRGAKNAMLEFALTCTSKVWPPLTIRETEGWNWENGGVGIKIRLGLRLRLLRFAEIQGE